MKTQPTVLLLASDERHRHAAECGLRAAGCQVSTQTAGVMHRTDLVVRDWRDERGLPPFIPVVTVDLALFQGMELAELVVRVLGLRPEPV